jgi:pimeloyl-ACP methyl ester carboxylesterase
VALGEPAWESLPAEVREVFTAASPAVLAEIRGSGLDLSEEPLELSAEELGGIGQPTLIVSAQDSPAVLRRVNDRLAASLPNTETVLVPGGHLIHPAHPAILDFIERVLSPLSHDDLVRGDG